jgi:hypothetical protein
MEVSLEAIAKRLRGSRLAVNVSKTKLCLFLWLDHLHIKIKIFNSEMEFKNTMNFLDVTFNSKLQWVAQLSNIILKANNSLNDIRLINNFVY